ncbi:hypothetical protein BASA50_008389 [Batrachochytrium salamandrivorans]|uniref:Uncharacterized protein n=1 Tax=Batrachochytrium salamandrivorans TaxID=1357716 RepID=A0ABQ8F450_9FUNG|nr:hypothetical protein BASA50_008389 [Batrachochytrium salamandrivorans]KAH9267632.1 hypothetical protein BASA83_009847 [Batrachochytrium salamandrivorans]
MKLISFAVISFLAITVSAFPPNHPDAKDVGQSSNEQQPPSTDAQGLEELQGASFQTTQDSSESFQQLLHDKLDDLIDEYTTKHAAANKLQIEVDKMENELSEIVLRTEGLDGPEKEESMRDFFAKQRLWSGKYGFMKSLEHGMATIKKQYDDLVKEIA